MIKETEPEKEMQQNVDIERPGKREENENQGKRVKETRLEITHEGRPAKIVCAPVRDCDVFQTCGQVVFHRVEPPMDISEEKGLAGNYCGIEKQKDKDNR